MKRIETLSTKVLPCHCDAMGHLTTAQYALLFDAATWALLEHMGVHDDFQLDGDRGWADVEATTTYRQEVRAGTLVRILSGVSRAGARSMRISHHLIAADGARIHAIQDVTTVHVDRHKRTAVEIPAIVRTFVLQGE